MVYSKRQYSKLEYSMLYSKGVMNVARALGGWGKGNSY